jgi:hypothetical protein
LAEAPTETEARRGLQVEIHPLLAKEVDVTQIQSQAVSFIPKSSIATVKVQKLYSSFSYSSFRQIKGWPKQSQPKLLRKRAPFP